MQIEVQLRTLLTLALPFALAASGILGISTSLKAAPLPQRGTSRTPSAATPTAASIPKSLGNFQSNLSTVEEMLKLSCSNQLIDTARASLAYKTYERSNLLLNQLQSDIQANLDFLNDAQTIVRSEYSERAQASERAAQNNFRTAIDAQEYIQGMYQAGKASRISLARATDNLNRAQAALKTAGLMPSEETIHQSVQTRTNNALSYLKQLEGAAQQMSQISTRAEGCYTTASGTGTLANPQMNDQIVPNKAQTGESSAETEATPSKRQTSSPNPAR